jgi:hypothetical protein
MKKFLSQAKNAVPRVARTSLALEGCGWRAIVPSANDGGCHSVGRTGFGTRCAAAMSLGKGRKVRKPRSAEGFDALSKFERRCTCQAVALVQTSWEAHRHSRGSSAARLRVTPAHSNATDRSVASWSARRQCTQSDGWDAGAQLSTRQSGLTKKAHHNGAK